MFIVYRLALPDSVQREQKKLKNNFSFVPSPPRPLVAAAAPFPLQALSSTFPSTSETRTFSDPESPPLPSK